MAALYVIEFATARIARTVSLVLRPARSSACYPSGTPALWKRGPSVIIMACMEISRSLIGFEPRQNGHLKSATGLEAEKLERERKEALKQFRQKEHEQRQQNIKKEATLKDNNNAEATTLKNNNNAEATLKSNNKAEKQ